VELSSITGELLKESSSLNSGKNPFFSFFDIFPATRSEFKLPFNDIHLIASLGSSYSETPSSDHSNPQ
jgi:hypothetical protein